MFVAKAIALTVMGLNLLALWDTTTIVAATAALTSVLTLLLTKGIDAWLRLRKSNMEDQQYKDTIASRDRDLLIKEFTTRLSSLSAELKQVQADHLACVEKWAEARKELEILREDVKSLREWRHTIGNEAQKIVATVAVDKLSTPPQQLG